MSFSSAPTAAPALRHASVRWPISVIGCAGLAFVLFYTVGLVFADAAYLRFQSNWIYNIAPAATFLLCCIPIKGTHGRQRLGWCSLAILTVAWGLGDWLYTYYNVRYDTDPPFPGTADVLYYAGYVAFSAGIMLLVFPSDRIRDQRWVADALVVLGVAGAISWTYLVEPILGQGYSSRDAAIAMGYPLLDLVLFAQVVFALYASGGKLRPRALLLMASAAALVIADGGYTYLVSTVGYESIGNPLDPLWLASYLLIGVCCVLPEEDATASAPTRQSLAGLVLPYIAALPLVALAITEFLRGNRPVVLVAAAVVVAGLIVVRQLMTLRENLFLFQALERESAARRALLDRVVTAQEDERHRVALDLHDGPVQSLSFLATRLGSAKKFLQRGETERAISILSDVETAVTKEVQVVRDLMMNMRPPSLGERGVDSAVRDLAAEVGRQSGVRIEVSGSVGARADHATESIVYRLAQEALTNVRKHAAAAKVLVTLDVDGDSVILRVEDDGCGFEMKSMAELVAVGQYGLLGMIERTELLHGHCAWHRREPQGTEFVARIPVPSEWSLAA